MKDTRVPRLVTSGWTAESLRLHNTEQFAAMRRKTVLRMTVRMVVLGSIPLTWLLPGTLTLPGVAKLALFMASVIAGFVALSILSKLPEQLRRRSDEPYRPEMRSNDPGNAAEALDALLVEIRSAPAGSNRLNRAYETAVSRLQAIRPLTPLHALVRRGYYPSRPAVTLNNGQTTKLDNDQSSDEVHWDRMCSAADDLRELLRSPDLVARDEMYGALSHLIPPMRAVLRRHGVATNQIEYLPGTPRKALATPDAETTTNVAAPDEEAQSTALPEDGLSPVEDRLNASATMAVSAIRTLVLSFQAAEEDMFVGDDLDTGRRLMSQHVPSLIRAYIVAHDASQGEERDQIRAEFAQGLGVVRDTLAGIMRRHAQEARNRMEIETSFLRMRHGKGDDGLSPASEMPVF